METHPETVRPTRAGDQRYLDAARAAADRYTERAAAPATLVAYARDFEDFRGWCEQLGLRPMPAVPMTVASCVASLAAGDHKASTVDRRTAAIAYMHRWEGEAPTTTDAARR